MISLLLAYFLLMLVIHIIERAGTAYINEIAWHLYNRIPITTSKTYAEQSRWRKEVLRLKRELGSVSAQDQFSRWAKLRREHDKAVAELEKCSSALSTSRTRFDRSTNIARLACTTGLRFFLQFWFAKRPLFWLPEGLFPGWLEWCLALPRAPKGSISLHVWGMACSASIQYVQSMLDVGFQTVSTEKVTEGRPKENGSGMSSRMEMERGKEWEKEKTHAFDSSGRLREESNKEL